MSDPLVVTWVLIALSTGKFSEDLEVTSHASKEACVQAAEASRQEEWSCFPVALPEGQPFEIVTRPPPPPFCTKSGGKWPFAKEVEVPPGTDGAKCVTYTD